MPLDDLKKTVGKNRLVKWFNMTSFVLDIDLQHKIYKIDANHPLYKKSLLPDARKYLITDYGLRDSYSEDWKQIKEIKFTNYAFVGLRNFFEAHPQLFIHRLAKGPPP